MPFPKLKVGSHGDRLKSKSRKSGLKSGADCLVLLGKLGKLGASETGADRVADVAAGAEASDVMFLEMPSAGERPDPKSNMSVPRTPESC